MKYLIEQTRRIILFLNATFFILLYPCSLGFTCEKEYILKENGTLVVGLATKDGLLICADKRTYDYLRGDLDNNVKIVQLTNSIAIASTGNPIFYDVLTNNITNEKHLRLAFSADDVTKEYFLKNKFIDTYKFWEGLSVALREQFEKYLSARSYEYWPETGNPPDNALFRTAIFYIDSKKKPGVVYILFHYIKSIPPTITIDKSEEQKITFSRVRPIILGNIAVYEEIQSGHDKRFDDIRNDKLIHRYLHERPLIKNVSVNEALKFAQKLIKLTSERTHLIENSNFHVGPKTDSALLDYRSGFKWLSKDAEY